MSTSSGAGGAGERRQWHPFLLSGYLWKLKSTKPIGMLQAPWTRRFFVVEERMSRAGVAEAFFSYYADAEAAKTSVRSARDSCALHDVM